jgi:hypothetical protein
MSKTKLKFTDQAKCYSFILWNLSFMHKQTIDSIIKPVIIHTQNYWYITRYPSIPICTALFPKTSYSILLFSRVQCINIHGTSDKFSRMHKLLPGMHTSCEGVGIANSEINDAMQAVTVARRLNDYMLISQHRFSLYY